ncbi:hypothetical protein jhhlp_002058 [Lomentospora prolificans]|uniref:Uncharacterized protein n=1 Tax=Lomentospora prolificans TaxID=41688 RepID=A0A2N3ND17_9PEZI|nr:hypothetical protein jhhlp_002058 [Lomentospora prolificans]
MSLETIYVVRHGFRCSYFVDPVSGVASTNVLSPTKIAADPPLTAHGIDQAQELGAYLMSLDPPIEAVYSSPYYRCLQTISPFVSLRNEQVGKSQGKGANSLKPLAIRSERGIGEFYGEAHFDQPQPAPHSFLKTMFPVLDDSFESGVVPAKKGESIEGLYDRVRAAVEKIVERCDQEGIRSAILCSHAAVIIALGRVLTGNIPDKVEVQDFDTFTCGLSVFKRHTASPNSYSALGGGSDELPTGSTDCPAPSSNPPSASSPDGIDGTQRIKRTGNWICKANSDCSFLTGGPERGWHFTGDESFLFGDPVPGSDAASGPPENIAALNTSRL